MQSAVYCLLVLVQELVQQVVAWNDASCYLIAHPREVLAREDLEQPTYHLKGARQTVAANLDKSGQHPKLEGGTSFPYQSLVGLGGDYIASVDSQGAGSKSSQRKHRRDDGRPQRKPVPEVPRDRYGMHAHIFAVRSSWLGIAGQDAPFDHRECARSLPDRS